MLSDSPGYIQKEQLKGFADSLQVQDAEKRL